MKKIILISIIILAIGFIYKVISYTSSNSYNFIEKDELRLNSILNRAYLDSIDITTAVGNKNDTLFQIKLKHYCLLVWNISNYKNITKDHIMLDFNQRNRNFYFTPFSNREISPVLTLKYKMPDHISKEISLNLSLNSEVYDSIEYKQEKGYCLKTTKFGIGNDKKRSNIIFDFHKEKREVVFMFYNKEGINYLLVFYSFNDLKIDKSTLINMLN
jgi:hypothetical protein